MAKQNSAAARTARFRAAALLVPLWLWAGPAAAITFTIDPTSSLSGKVAAGFSVVVNTSLGNVSGSGMVSGDLAATANGTVVGNPNPTLTQLDFQSATIQNPNPGPANGSATLDVFGFIPLTLDVTINVQNIGLVLADPTTTALAPAGPGVWSFAGNPNLLIGATASGSASGPLGIGFGVPPFTFGGNPPGIVAPIAGTLESLGDAGSRLVFSGTDLTIDVPLSGMSQTVPVGECIGGELFGACLGVRIHSLQLTLNYIQFTDVDAHIVATSSEPLPAPEASALALLGIGAALVGVRARPARRRSQTGALHASRPRGRVGSTGRALASASARALRVHARAVRATARPRPSARAAS